MKKPHIRLVQQGKGLSGLNLAHLGTILELMNFEVELDRSKGSGKAQSAWGEGAPDLIILDRPPYPDSSASRRGVPEPSSLGCPVLILSEEKTLLENPPDDTDRGGCPIDVIALHDLITRNLSGYPRKNLRMPAHLPCLFSVGLCTYFAEILSLGTGGGFIKTTCQNVRPGDSVDVWIPLLGMKVELEIRSHILYVIAPKQENNYLQGIGIGFISPSAEITRKLGVFLRHSLLNDIYPVFPAFGAPGPRTELLKLPPASCHEVPFR